MIDNIDIGESTNCCYMSCRAVADLLKDNRISLLHLNIRSYAANFKDLSALLDMNKVYPSVIILTETWFNGNSCQNITGYTSYHSFRVDRGGGGVSIYVRSDYKSYIISQLCVVNNDMESCGVNVVFDDNLNVKILGVYRPPNNIDSFNSYFFDNMISQFRPAEQVVVGGDLNIDLINPTPAGLDYITRYHCNSYMPLVNIATRITDTSATCIDHFWTNILIDIVPAVINVNITDHFPIMIILKCSKRKELIEKMYRDHRECNLSSLLSESARLIDIMRPLLSNEIDVNYSTNVFHESLYKIYNSCCPINKKTISVKRLSKPWVTDDLLLAINRKHSLFKDYKLGVVSFDMYKQYNNFVTREIKKSKKSYFDYKFQQCRGNLRGTWKQLNELLNRKNKSGGGVKLRCDNGGDITNGTEVANYFNYYFTNVGTTLDRSIAAATVDPLQYMGDRNIRSFFASPATAGEVAGIIKSLPNKSPGIDCIPTLVFKHVSLNIVHIISNLFNNSLLQGIFPTCLKHAKVIPIFKSGDACIVSNYRPISILQILSKIFEKLMHVRLYSFLNRCSILNSCQFGFRQNFGTEDAVLEYLSDTYTSLDSKKYFITLFLDFSKAFDTVNHRILINKLEHMGIRGTVNQWFDSYLDGRTQHVHVMGTDSNHYPISVGIPQGSNLGPLLFIMYINDMHKCCPRLKCIHFADDTTLYCSHAGIGPLEDIVNSELRLVDEWLKANRLSLNVGKTSYMVTSNRLLLNDLNINIRNTSINRVYSAKFLGITIDSRLDFKDHVKTVSVKISRAVGAISRVQPYVPQQTLLNLYNTLVYPLLSYGVCAWGNSSVGNGNIIRRLQGRMLRVFRRNNYHSTFNDLNILCFEYIYEYFVLTKFYRYKNKHVHVYFDTIINNLEPVHRYPTRFVDLGNLNIPHHRLGRSQNSFMFSAVNFWNELPQAIRGCTSLYTFKRHLKLHLLLKQDTQLP